MRTCRLTQITTRQGLLHRDSTPFRGVQPRVYSSTIKPVFSKAPRPQLSRRVLSGPTVAPESTALTGPKDLANSVEALSFLDRAVLQNDLAPFNATPPKKRTTLETPEQLASTAGHKAIVTLAFGLLGAIASEGLVALHSPAASLGAAAAVCLAFVLAGVLADNVVFACLLCLRLVKLRTEQFSGLAMQMQTTTHR